MKKIIYKILRKIYYLLPIKEEVRKKIYEKKNRKKYVTADIILKKISKYDIISFDIFDTLVTRIIYEPDDIFKLMGEKLKINSFIEKRKQAEQEARKNLQKDVNLNEIYDSYQKINKITDTERKNIQQLEENLEIKFIVPRVEMKNLVNELYNKNKKMIIVSDMYLTKNVIIKMLKKCGYNINMFDYIYISNDINKRKDTEEVWPYIKNIYKNKKIVHIGDNNNSDVILPKKHKINTVKINSSKELFINSNLYESLANYVNNRTVSDSILLGLIINKTIFNSPFTNYKINSVDKLGYCFYGTILNQFMKFIIDKTNNQDQLLFLAREGYYLQKIYQEYCNLYNVKPKENIYFLTSRKSTFTATIYNEEDIDNLINKEFNGTFETFMNQIFDIKVEDNTIIQLPRDVELVKAKVEQYKKSILDNCKKERLAYLSYIKQTVKKYDNKLLSVIDLGYSGTIQYNLTKLLDREIIGVYLTNSENVKKYSKDSTLLYCFDINKNDNYKYIYYYSLILEYFLSAPYGQLQKFEMVGKNAKPVFNNETIDSNKKNCLNEIYKGIKLYFKDIHDIEDVYKLNFNLDLIVDIYKNIVDKNVISNQVKDRFDFMDSFESSNVRNVFKIISKY